MKILVVAPTPFFSNRGTHIRILEEALAMEKRGHDITIATYHIGEDISKEIDTKIDVRRILRLLFWYKKLEAGPDWQKIILDLMLIRKTFFLARTKKPDIIHGHLHEGILIGWLVKRLLFWRKMKLVADVHGSLTGEMSSHGYLSHGFLETIFKKLEKIINNLGDWAITSSWECTEDIKRARRDGKVETILDGINLDSFRLKSTKEAIKKEWEIPENKFIVGYTGGLLQNKGISYLLEAIPLVVKKNPDIYFLIGGFPAEDVEKFISVNNMNKFIRLISPLDYFKLPEFLSICDVAVDPKRVDTGQASGKILNYMAAGLPVICFDKTNNRKYLGEGGQFCPEMTPDSIAQGISYLKDHPEEIRKKGEYNKHRANEYSWDKPAERVEEIYNLAINN